MQPALHEEGWSQPVCETVTYVTPRPLPNASIFSLVSGVVHFVVVLNSEHLSPQSQQHAFFSALDFVVGGVNNNEDDMMCS
ncbi:hypothetical protein QTG54_008677 [Skeletonema marinoi]|uniref:Uncharacterized protein n=1 Tax=Skeletonema marinoi TaxID=267567 RepID=A0AAD8Y6T6_9STRA|nr:hypothetical protein QTG54_008677 [Skeletonema marinoi]